MGKRLIYRAKLFYLDIKQFCSTASRATLIAIVLKNIGILLLLSNLFYDSFFYLFVLAPVFFLLFAYDVKRVREKEKDNVLIQFQDMLELMSQSLQAGASVETSFIRTLDELTKMHGENACIVIALIKIVNGLAVNVPIEKLVSNMADSIDESEIELFASVFSGTKRSGADMVEIVAFSANSLIEKLRVKREISRIISSKKLEQNIMSIVPMAILLYVKLCCGEFISGMYHNLSGVLLMTVFLVLYAVAFIWSKRIMNIEV